MSIPQITVQDLQQILQAHAPDTLQLIDVREPQELDIANLNHLGFRNYPLSQYQIWSASIVADLDPHHPTYVLCHHGVRSAQMSQWLIQQGFTQVRNIVGGIDAWSSQIDPQIPFY